LSDLILHHYAMSPYAEKIRICMGIKGLTWKSVDAPMVMPKPDYVELTGGYRRVPALQVGADIYCDTACITRELERRFPTPALYPPGQETTAHALSQWAETTFMMVVLAFFGIGGVFDEEFMEDRKATMVPPGMNVDGTSMILPTKLLQIESNLARIEAILADGRSFLLGDAPSVADTAAYHPLLFLGSSERTAKLLAPYKAVAGWSARMAEIGHGTVTPLAATDAIEVARAAEPEVCSGEAVVPEGMAIGTPVLVLPDEYGSGNVAGALAASGLHEIAVRRETERAGTVVVHFPRETYGVIATG
jgi:glutathione S-transferase